MVATIIIHNTNVEDHSDWNYAEANNSSSDGDNIY